MKQTNSPGHSAHPKIRYILGDSSLDRVLVARSSNGVCAIFMGSDDAELEGAFRALYPAAERVENPPATSELGRALGQVVAFIDAPQCGLDLRLDLRGTDFQQRVWQALREVQLGERASYSEIARAIGKPTAARAVAGACAANRVSLAVPCHRIVRGDGGLSGYRWGVERKRVLLEREAASVSR